MKSIKIVIPLPHKTLHPNFKKTASRGAVIGRTYKVAQARGEARLAALAALEGRAAPKWEKAMIQADFYLGTRGRRQDPMNLIAYLKASVDGLQDAGILKDDNGLGWLAPSQLYGKDCQEQKVVLTIFEEQP